MRFVAAIVSFVIAFGLIGLGIAQRTVFAEGDRVTSEAAAEQDAPITIVDGVALNARDGRQKLEIGNALDDQVFAAYGRTGDLIAWAGDTSYNYVTYDAETKSLSTEYVRGDTQEAIDPAGSDLWIGEYSKEGAVEFTVNLPEDVSVIVLSDGLEPAPSDLSVTWAVDNRAPWSGPILVGGVLFLLLGLGLYLWALAHLRKTRGPRRKPPKQISGPKLPSKPRYNYRKAAKAVRSKPKAIENPRGRRSAARMTAVLPIVLVGAVVLSGCSADNWPDFITGRASDPMPAPTASALASTEVTQTPAVTVPQLEEIVKEISVVAAEADEGRDAKLAKTRFTGAALQLRAANYKMRGVDNSLPDPTAIPAGPVQVTLPQQSDVWPRTVFAVIQKPATEQPAPSSTDAATEEPPEEEETPAEDVVVPTALMLVQESPREPYKVAYSVVLEANAVLPDVAAATIGSVRQDPANKMLVLPPGELAAAYADVMMLGAKSEFYELFDYEGDALLPGVGAEAKAARAKKLSTTKLGHSTVTESVGDPIAMSSLDAGAIVTVSTAEVETAKPKESGAILSPSDGTKALSGVKKTTKGVSATYAYQLLFYVPPAASDQKIRLLGFSEGLVAAKEL